MTLDQAVALSLIGDLSRVDLTARLQAADPLLLDRASRRLGEARAARIDAHAHGISVLPWNDPRFPPQLLAIPDVPPVLWYRGDVAALDAPLVAIVGSRSASMVSREIATTLARDLAGRGLTIVSGLARGVDSAAHHGALQTGRTVAVLGSGVDRIYPSEHAALATEIAGRGLVLSEYPPGTPPLAFHFPERNRIISGLSRAVVVIEASEKSGSLITAGCALQQGRDVLAVPGNALSGRNRGGHALIRDGARIVERADDVLEELGLLPSAAVARPGVAGLPFAYPMLDRMASGETYDLDALASMTGLGAARLLPVLAELELRGHVRRLAGGGFMRLA